MSNLSALMDLSTAILINGIQRKVVFGIFLIAAFYGCKEKSRPVGILSEKEIAAYMVDIYLTEARVNALSVPRDSAMGLFQPQEEKLLAERGVTDSVLKKSYQYYLGHPGQLEKIYDSVIDTLVLMEEQIRKKPTGKKL